MASSQVPFETTQERRIRNTRRNDQRDAATDPVGYVAVEGGIRGLIGDHIGPYMHAIGRASADGNAGLVSVSDGEAQRLATDELGHLWTRAGVGGGAALSFHTTAALDQSVSQTAARRVYQIRAALIASVITDRFLQVHDSAVPVPNNAIPIWEILVPGGLTTATTFAMAGDGFGDVGGLPLTNGLILAISTTAGVLTLPAAGGDALPFEATFSV